MGSFKQPGVSIVDIRVDKSEQSLADVLRQSLRPNNDGPKTMPTLLLYDENGLKIFEKITYLEEYYLTNAEIEVLEKHADTIAARVPEGSRLVELGSGNLRKINILLRAFERAQKKCEYYALDLSLSELQRTFAEVDTSAFSHVSFHGLHGTYDDGFAWLSKPENRDRPTCVLTLGSSIGNFSRAEGAEFLAHVTKSLGPGDSILVGLDACQNSRRVFHAYNDKEGITEAFYRNGLEHANRLLGREVFKQKDWQIEGFYDSKENRHVASYVAVRDSHDEEYSFEQGEKLKLEDAYKYSIDESDQLWHDAGLIPQMSYGNAMGDYFVHLLSPSNLGFSDSPEEYATHPIPSLDDWKQLWTAWDIVTKSMVPRDELLNKPIQLRNNLIFYLGHIPTFADIHFTKATSLKPTDPAMYYQIFERGIDPDVDDPSQCHAHSEIPDEWPPLAEILDYQARVRARITEAIQSGKLSANRKLARGIWLAYEHEAMHLETFLYMLLQSARVLPPPGGSALDFKTLADKAAAQRSQNEWHHLNATKIRVGLDDPENNEGPDRYFGWDNERPSRTVAVKGFEVQSRPISNGEYARFLEATKTNAVPASWVASQNAKHSGSNGMAATQNGSHGNDNSFASSAFVEGKAVRTVYGQVPLKYAMDWPVMASYDELAAYAQWSGGRIPTLEEARSIYNYVESNKRAAEQVPSKLISAVNGHLSNEGVEETPPSNPSSHTNGVSHTPLAETPDPTSVFIDLTGCDIAFKHWHPQPVTHEGHRVRGQSDMGGLWEWTSTPLAAFEGFKAMDLYPGYTADFFDGKHNIVLGGSWATVPRIAGRRSFVNWYQRNYPYTWATARLVRDAE